MKVRVLRLMTPDVGEMMDGKIIVDRDGQSYLEFKDLVGVKRLLVTDDVKPIRIESGGILNKSITLYVMARDAFVTVDQSHFVVKGEMTRELVKRTASWGFLAELSELSKEKSQFDFKLILLLLLLGAGAYLIWPHISGALGGVALF